MEHMDIQITISVSIEHTEGKFAPKDELVELLTAEVEAANPGSVEADGGGQYEVTTWDVEAG